jgi:hypothetical protein
MREIGKFAAADERSDRAANICYRAIIGAFSTMRETSARFYSNGSIRIIIAAIATLEHWSSSAESGCGNADAR